MIPGIGVLPAVSCSAHRSRAPPEGVTALTDDRRAQDYRVRATFRVRYNTMDDLVVAYSGNLSRGGLFLATNKVLPVGSVVRLQLELPDGGPEIIVPCNVAFVREASEDPEGGPTSGQTGMGVKFIDPDDLTRRRLEWFILNSAPEPGQLKGQTFVRRINLVIVDDDPLQAQSAAEPFRARGDQVRVARDGLEALALCLKQRPDVLLSDVEMPRMDGWQLLRLVRSRPALTSVPVIFLTQLSGEQDRLLGYRLGVDDYLSKPTEAAELLARVDGAVIRSEQQAKSAPREANALRGDLQQVGVASVLAFLEIEKKTGVLRVGPITNGRIYISEGRPIAVEVEGASQTSSPRELIFRLLDLKKGRFEFSAKPVSKEDQLGLTTTNILLAHAAERDEQAQG
jgi:uncharacterized protein (TIGR02266 family)